MSAEFPTLAEIIGQAIGDAIADCAQLREGIGGPQTAEIINSYAEAASDAWEESRIIHTGDQLDALPEHAIVRAGTNGHAYEKSMLFTLIGRRWMEAGNSSPERSDDIGLPALLIWHPSWAQP